MNGILFDGQHSKTNRFDVNEYSCICFVERGGGGRTVSVQMTEPSHLVFPFLFFCVIKHVYAHILARSWFARPAAGLTYLLGDRKMFLKGTDVGKKKKGKEGLKGGG